MLCLKSYFLIILMCLSLTLFLLTYHFSRKSMIPVSGNNRISPESAGKRRGKSFYPAEKHRKSLEDGSSIPTGKFSDFFGDSRPISCCFRQELVVNHRRKSENFRPEYYFHAVRERSLTYTTFYLFPYLSFIMCISSILSL
jgi:hypothetical protein